MAWQPSDRVRDAALALIDQRRVRLIEDAGTPGALVLGDHDDLLVYFVPTGMVCECMAGCEVTPLPVCKHELAAMICWGDHLA